MKRSLTLLQECYRESESDEEQKTETIISSSKDNSRLKLLSCDEKGMDFDDKSHLKNSKSLDDQNNLTTAAYISGCVNMTISLHDIPLPPDDLRTDRLQSEIMPYSEESSSDDDIPIYEKLYHSEKAISDSQNSILEKPPLPIGDILEENVQFERMSYLKEDINDDEKSSSEDSKSPAHEDKPSDSKVLIAEESLLPPDDAYKINFPYEAEPMYFDGMNDDETSGSEDLKSYDNHTGLAMSSESRSQTSQTALASLHETYTDSEGEIESDAEGENTKEKYLTPSKDSTPSSGTMDDTSKDKPQSKLVSYATEGMDDEMSDSEDSKSSSDHQDDSSDSRVYVSEVPPLSPVSFHRKLVNVSKNEIQLPPEPKGRCSKSLQEKISELYEKRKQGKDMNASIQKRKDFRNPSIYEKLIQFCNIDEQGTNYPPEIYDPHCWGPESFYEELAKRQKEEMDKREKEKKERTKVEFISGTAKKTGSDSTSEGAKRKSKWDIGINQMPAAALKPATLITPTVLPVPTGTKPTVISAFGTISKKAKQ